MSSLTVPDVQRAWINVAQGPPSKALTLKEDWPVPKTLAPGEILIRVQAAALNPVGYKLYKLLPNWIARRPRIAEFDLSGVVVDPNGTNFSVGDEVFGWVPSRKFRDEDRLQGALAQYTRVSADALIKRPSNVTPVESAGFALAGLTAYDAVVKKANIQPGQFVFVNGGSSSVGAYAIQLAKIRGAKVYASASGKNEAFVRNLGVDEFVDYTKVSLTEYLAAVGQKSKFDFIFDAVGLVDPSLYTKSDSYLSPKGAFLSVGAQPKNLSWPEIYNTLKTVAAMVTPTIIGGNKARYTIAVAAPSVEGLQLLQRYASAGSLKPVVDSVFDFDDTLKAYDRLLTGRATGKVVVKVDSSIN